MRIELLDSSEKDLLDGYVFYEHQSKGLGNYFLESLFSDIDSLYLYAGIHAIHFGYNRSLSKRFPFAIYYKSDKEIIRVYAILDCRRNPSWIRNRLS
jgi:hypothetical protein